MILDISKEEFCSRFRARMVSRIGQTFDEGESVAEYADRVAPSYYNGEFAAEGPESCADIDMECWGY